MDYDNPRPETGYLEKAAASQMIREPTIRENLEHARKRFQAQLDEINRAIDLFDKYPELAEFSEVLRKVSRY